MSDSAPIIIDGDAELSDAAIEALAALLIDLCEKEFANADH